MADLSSAYQKIDRANVHIAEFERVIEDILHDNSRTVRMELYEGDATHHQEVRWDRFSLAEVEAQRLNQIDGFRWDGETGVVPVILSECVNVFLNLESAIDDYAPRLGPIIGDVVHNLRSALDHLVYALTVKRCGEPPSPLTHKDEWWKHIGFPIRRKQFWPLDTSGAPVEIALLKGVDPALWGRFQDLQPDGKDFERTDLWMLNELWNWDKHRTIHLVATNVEFLGIEPLPDGLSEHFITEPIKVSALGPAKDGAHLALVKVTPKFIPDHTHRGLQMQVNTRVSFEVAFPQSPPGYGENVRAALRRWSNLTHKIVSDFAPEFSSS